MNVWPDNPPPYIAGADGIDDAIAAALASMGADTTRQPARTGPSYLTELVNRYYFDARTGNFGRLAISQQPLQRQYFLIDQQGKPIQEVNRVAQLYDYF